jgi:hypothetical protein
MSKYSQLLQAIQTDLKQHSGIIFKHILIFAAILLVFNAFYWIRYQHSPRWGNLRFECPSIAPSKPTFWKKR